MRQFEDDLKRALRVEDVPEDLTERVMGRIHAGSRRSAWRPDRRRLLAVAAVVVLAVGFLSGLQAWRHREGERVKDELILGLRVVSASLRQIEERVRYPLEGVGETIE
jgi:hypothetical protein